MKKNYLILIFFVFISAIIIGCTKDESKPKTFKNIEDAISYGLTSLDAQEVLRTDLDEHEKIIVFTRDKGESMGIAHVVAVENRYEWKDQAVAVVAEYVIGNEATKEGTYVIVGKATKENAKQAKINGIGFKKIVDIQNGYFVDVSLPNRNIISVEML